MLCYEEALFVTRLQKVISCRTLTTPDHPKWLETCTQTHSMTHNQKEHTNSIKKTKQVRNRAHLGPLAHPVTWLQKVISCRPLASSDRPQRRETCTRTLSMSHNQQETQTRPRRRKKSETVPTSALCHPVTRLQKVISCRPLTSSDRQQGRETCTRTPSMTYNQQEHTNSTNKTKKVRN